MNDETPQASQSAPVDRGICKGNPDNCDPHDCGDAHSAPVAGMTDTDLIEGLRKSLEWDGHGYWLIEACIKEREGGDEFTSSPSKEEFREALAAALREKAGGGA